MFSTTTQEAVSLIDRALTLEPRLGHFGFGIYNERQKLRDIGADVVAAELAKERDSLCDAVDEVRAAADWVKLQERSPSPNELHTSYGYKHCVEQWFRKKNHNVYVANGAFIAAAVGLGWSRKVDGPNALFCFSERTVLDPESGEGCSVYFIQAGSGAIKIGHSADVPRRLDQLRTGNHLPLSLLAEIRCRDVASAMDLERQLHGEFAHLRLEGEWFKLDAEIVAASRGR